MNCTCGLPKTYDQCCGLFIDGEDSPETPELLMRSRFSAFARKNWDYLLATVDPQVRVDFAHPENKKWMEECQFTQLEIIATSFAGNKGFVEFKAHYQQAGELKVHHEKSKFRKLDGVWYYRA